MKFQRVYAAAHEKKRAKEAIKQEKEAEIEKKKKKQEKQAEKLRRRKIWEEEQLRKKMEEEIFGKVEPESDEKAPKLGEKIEEKVIEKSEKSNFMNYLLLFFLISIITVYILNWVQ